MVEEHAESSDAAGSGGPDEAPGPPEDRPEAAARGPAPVAGRYRVGEFLAASRLGRTYRGRDTETDEDVEVTFLDADAVADAPSAEAWLEELRGLRHLHVLPLLDWEIAPVPYLVHAAPEMRLDRLISAGVALSPSQALLIGLQAAETLGNLRGRGIAHGALTPAHLCVEASGRLRLAELGLDFLRAPLEPQEATRYDAPEAVRFAADWESSDEDAARPEPLEGDAPGDAPGGASEGGPEDAAEGPEPAEADVYALGLALAEAAAGRPVAAESVTELGRAIVPPGTGQATARHLARLAPLLAQATATKPQNRLEADELALALRATAEMLPPPARLDEVFRGVVEVRAVPEAVEEAEAVAQPERDRRKPLMQMASAAAVVVAGALLVRFAAGGDDAPSHAVPDVVGADWTAARGTLAASGWEVRRLEVRVADAPAGEVVGQLPEAGGLLDEGQAVKVQVNLGAPLIVIPADIVGLPLEEAGLRLSEAGLALGTVESRVDPSQPPGTVVAVSEMLPELPRGSQVDLVVAGGR